MQIQNFTKQLITLLIHKFSKKTLLLFCALFSFTLGLFAETTYWTGDYSTSWRNPSNWSTSSTPSSSAEVIFKKGLSSQTVVLKSDTTIEDLKIQVSTQTITIDLSGFNLTVKGTTYLGDRGTSGGSLKFEDSSYYGTGSVTLNNVDMTTWTSDNKSIIANDDVTVTVYGTIYTDIGGWGLSATPTLDTTDNSGSFVLNGNVVVKDSGTTTDISKLSVGDNVNLSGSSDAVTLIRGRCVWTGSTDTDWSTKTNWKNSTVPTSSKSVYIPSSVTNFPVLSEDSSAHSIQIESGATLTCTTYSLTVTKSIINYGTVTGGTVSCTDFENSGTFEVESMSVTGYVTLSSSISASSSIDFSSSSSNVFSVLGSSSGDAISVQSGTSISLPETYTVTTTTSSLDASAISFTGSGTLSLGADITTNGGAVTFACPVVLTKSITINTVDGPTSSSTTATGSDVTFNSTLKSTTTSSDGSTTEGLTITAGSGNVTFAGQLGESGAIFGDIVINSCSDVSFTTYTETSRMRNFTSSGTGAFNAVCSFSVWYDIDIEGASSITFSGHSATAKYGNLTFVTTGDISLGSCAYAGCQSGSQNQAGCNLYMEAGGAITCADSIYASGNITILNADTFSCTNNVESYASGATVTFGGASTVDTSKTYSGGVSFSSATCVKAESGTIYFNNDVTSSGSDFSLYAQDFYFFGNATFTSAKFALSSTDSSGQINFYYYNTDTTAISFSSSATTMPTSSCIYFVGNISLNFTTDITCQTFYLKDTTNGTYYNSSSFECDIQSKITATSSGNSAIFMRESSTDGVIATVCLNADFTADTLETHSGVYVNVASGTTCALQNFQHVSQGNTPQSTFENNGTLTCANNFAMSVYDYTTQLVNNGNFSALAITGYDTAYSNGDAKTAIENTGTIELTNLALPTKNKWVVNNSGTIKVSTATTFSARKFTGTGTICIENGSNVTIENSASSESAQNKLSITDSTVIVNCPFTLTDFEATDSLVTINEALTAANFSVTATQASKTLSLQNDVTITSSLTLQGGSESTRLSLSAGTDSKTNVGYGFILSGDLTGGDFLSIDDVITVKDASSTVGAHTYTCTTLSPIGQTDSVPTASLDADDYMAVLENGWVILDVASLIFKWTGANSVYWDDKANWDLNYVPFAKTSVIIPDGLTRYPSVAKSSSTSTVTAFYIRNLTVGTDTEATHDATISLSSLDLVLDDQGSLTNYGTIIYAGSARIKQTDVSGTSSIINDTTRGTIEFASATGTIDLFDFYDVKFTGGKWALAMDSSSYRMSANSIYASSSASLTLGGNISASSTDSSSYPIEIDGALNLTANTTLTSGGKIILTDNIAGSAYELALTSGGEIYINDSTSATDIATSAIKTKSFTQTNSSSTSTVYISGDISCSNSISFASPLILTGDVQLHSDTSLTVDYNIDSDTSLTAGSARNLTLSSGSGTKGTTGETSTIVKISGALGSTSALNNISVKNADCKLSSILETENGGTISVDYDLYLIQENSSDKNAIYIGSADTAASSTKSNISVAGTLYAIASGKDFTINSDVAATGGILLLAGNMSLGANCSTLKATKDLVLMNGALSGSNSIFADSETGIEDLLSYENAARKTSANNSLATTGLSSASLTITEGTLNGKTLQTGANFYANGITFNATSEWNLSVLDNSGTNDFSEMHNCTVTNCKANYQIAAGENCTVTDCTNVYNTRPVIVEAYTISDDTIHVRFVDKTALFSLGSNPTATQIAALTTLPLENSQGEIKAALNYIRLTDGTLAFEGVYSDSTCETELTNTDIGEFYLKVSTNTKRWNTDATGLSEGETTSTDCGRMGSTVQEPVHRTNKPNITIPKALNLSDSSSYASVTSALYETLRDCHKNRITHYYDTNRYTDVSDKCNPVLISVKTGQEIHDFDEATPTSIKTYDAHNFIEFVFSENVTMGDVDTTSTDYPVVSESATNIQVTSKFGAISNCGTTSSDGIDIAGLANIKLGFLQTGSVQADKSNFTQTDSTVHAFYRNYSDYAGKTESDHKNSFRISIAGYVPSSSTVNVNGLTHYYWPGFIDSGVTPSGLVTVSTSESSSSVNDYIKDASGNSLLCSTKYKVYADSTATSSYNTGATSETSLYSAWDVSSPSFSRYLKVGEWNTDIGTYMMSEILGTDSTGDSYVDKFEIHFFDNTPQYLQSDEYQWVTKRGWVKSTETATDTNSIMAQDIVGGARLNSVTSGASNATLNANATSGGLRTSTLQNSVSAFSYNLAETTTVKSFDDTTFETSIASTRIFSAETNPNTADKFDSLYLSLHLQSSDSALYALRENFVLSYKAYSASDTSGGIITDLAGNRMKSNSVKSIDLTPPKIMMSMNPVGTNQLMLAFTKQLLTEYDTSASEDPLEVIPQYIELVKYDSDTSSFVEVDATDNAIDTTKKARVIRDSNNSTVLCVYLTGNTTYENINGYYVRIKQPATKETDPITGLDTYIPHIYDNKAEKNYIESHHMHVFSDFGVNVITPIYAYDTDNEVLQQGTYENGEWVVRDFSGEGQNQGKLYSEEDVTLCAQVTQNVQSSITDGATLYASIEPSAQSVSDVYNYNTGSNLKVWLPEFWSVLATSANTNVKTLSSSTPSGNDTLRLYEIPNNSSYGWESGSQVEFLFKLDNAFVDSDLDGTLGSSGDRPLYLLRLSDETDVGSLDLWRFDLQSLTKQRGGVTIMNNVIDVNAGEQTVLQVDVPTDGLLTIQVLTLDGNVITNLQRGKVSSGTYYYRWDGKNNGGRAVARGMYFIRVVGPGIEETRKVMCVKE